MAKAVKKKTAKKTTKKKSTIKVKKNKPINQNAESKSSAHGPTGTTRKKKSTSKKTSSKKKVTTKKKTTTSKPKTTEKVNFSSVGSYYMYFDDVLFPVPPTKVEMSINNKNETVDLVNGGEVNRLKAPGLTDIEIDNILLPQVQKYPFASYQGDFKNASYYLGKLEEWKTKKKVITFTLSRMYRGKLIYATSMNVSIEDYKITEDADNYGPFDVSVDINMKQWKPWGGKKLVILKSKKKSKKKAKVKKKKTSKSKSTSTVKYKIKKGDSLMKIAKKYYGSTSKWRSIYKANKSAIEKAANKHGRKSSSKGLYLYAGTVLTLKKAVTK